MEALITVLGKSDNLAILILLLVCAGLGWAHVVWRREEREDRRQLYAVVEANTRTVETLRTALSITTGKPL